MGHLPPDLPSMMNTSPSTASRLAAVSLAACLCAACPTALAQDAPRALDRSPAAGARQGGDFAQGVRVDRACNRLFDGRGEKIRAGGAGGAAGASIARDCRAQGTPSKPIQATKQLKTAPPTFQVMGVAPTPEAHPITAGSVQAEDASPRDRSARAPIPRRVSAGRLSATLVTSGTAMFLLQSSLWTYLLILGLPLWQHVDLLPIVDKATDDEAATGDAPDPDVERAVTHVLDAQRPRRGDAGGQG